MTKIKTTHVGSLPRSNELSDLLFKKDKKEKIDLENFDAVVKKDVNKIVKKQVDLRHPRGVEEAFLRPH